MLIRHVHDNATRQSYAGATDFDGVAGQEYPLTYNNAGSLTSDAGRRMARIGYDMMSNPVRIQFTNGNVTKYIYSATGQKYHHLQTPAASANPMGYYWISVPYTI